MNGEGIFLALVVLWVGLSIASALRDVARALRVVHAIRVVDGDPLDPRGPSLRGEP